MTAQSWHVPDNCSATHTHNGHNQVITDISRLSFLPAVYAEAMCLGSCVTSSTADSALLTDAITDLLGLGPAAHCPREPLSDR